MIPKPENSVFVQEAKTKINWKSPIRPAPLNFEAFRDQVLNSDAETFKPHGYYIFTSDACDLCKIYEERFNDYFLDQYDIKFVEVMNWELDELRELSKGKVKGLPCIATIYLNATVKWRVLNGDAPDSMIVDFVKGII